jgi:hypothetical protein
VIVIFISEIKKVCIAFMKYFEEKYTPCDHATPHWWCNG